jgi:hypothetical protein
MSSPLKNKSRFRRTKRAHGHNHSSKVNTERFPSTWMVARVAPFPKAGTFDNQVFNVVDGFENLAVLTTSTVGNTFVSITATFSSLNDYASYGAVFDQYRIMAMECMFYPSAANEATIAAVGHVHSVIDYDDNASITPAQALDYPNCVIVGLTDTQIRSFQPHAAIAAYAGGVFTSFANETSPWIDCTSTGVVHYGMKIAVNPTSIAMTFDSVVRCHLQFRNPR